jgi:hypothetical protein
MDSPCTDSCDCLANKCDINDKIECECNKKCDINDKIECECNKKCLNYLLCENLVEDSQDNLCVYCSVLNGVLDLEENTRNELCYVCLIKLDVIVNFPKKCQHGICTECYKKKFLFELDQEDDPMSVFNKCAICS